MLKRKSKGTAPKPAKTPKEAVLEHGKTWDMDVNARLRASRSRAWLFAMLMAGVAVLSILALLALLPLKTFEPYVVSVDRSTGYTEVVRGVNPGKLSEDEAVTEANIVKYVTYRETYDPQDIERNFYGVTAMSEGNALADYTRLWDSAAGETPSEVYGFTTTREVAIKSISTLADKTRQVRFAVTEKAPSGETVEDLVAVLTFDYVQRPTKRLELWQNPLGFKVFEYRVDEEILGR